MHIVFVTTELSPQLPGGAGNVVAGLRERLISRGDRVTVLLIAETDAELPHGVRAVGGGEDAGALSHRAAEALRGIVTDDPPDLIEFQDFNGLAFDALAHRSEIGIDRVPVQVRFHAPFDLIFEAIGSEPDWLPKVRSMEGSALRMADRIAAPTPAIGRLIHERYGVELDRIELAQPPVSEPKPLALSPSPGPLLVALGRLGEQKGSHDLISAAVPVLREHPDLRLVVIGEDGWSAAAERPMQEWLEEMTPSDVAHRIEFTGRLVGDARDRRLAEAWAAVVPSRFESFSLAAHEARGAGLPVVVSDLPAFAGTLDESTGALVYDGTSDGLTEALRLIIEDGELRRRLAAAPLPSYDDPLASYEKNVPVRHPRSQAGLATAAVQRLEQVEPTRVPTSSSGPAQRALRFVPRPVARAAVVLLPQRLKDRLRLSADWRLEQERRGEAERRSTLDSRIAGGDFVDLDRPRVSVVIPSFNQGRFINDAIRSVFEQSMTSFEVIVVDDGSTAPETLAVIDGLDWPRTRVIRQENRGLPAARNAGIEVARGEFVVPLDGDDELALGFLERMVAALDADPDAAFACCRARLTGDVDAVWVPRPYNPYQLLLSNSVVGCVLLRRDAWEAVGGYDETMRRGNEDWELWVRLLAAGWGVVEVDEPLFRYRKHGVSMSVETEARFEQGRVEIVDRHPDLYAADRLAALKRDYYPLLSILLPAGADRGTLPDDTEIIRVDEHGSLEESVAEARGKYVVHWSGITGASNETLDRLADVLESRPDLGAATTRDPAPIVLVRRWSLLDPAAPAMTERVDTPGSGDAQLSPGAFPDPAWMVPEAIDGVPVQRQRPEEDGTLPVWAKT